MLFRSYTSKKDIYCIGALEQEIWPIQVGSCTGSESRKSVPTVLEKSLLAILETVLVILGFIIGAEFSTWDNAHTTVLRLTVPRVAYTICDQDIVTPTTSSQIEYLHNSCSLQLHNPPAHIYNYSSYFGAIYLR